MAQIKGIAGITPEELSFEVNRGGKFVVYRYCISVIFLTMWRGTDIYFVRADQSRVMKGLPWTLLTPGCRLVGNSMGANPLCAGTLA